MPHSPSARTVLRFAALLQAAVLVPVGLAWLSVPVRALRSALAPSSDPTADLGPWVAPILLGITGLCILAAAVCLLPAIALPLCAGRTDRRGPFRLLVALESVCWLDPLLRADVPHTPMPGVLAAVLATLGAAVVALVMHPSVRTLRIPSPGVATRVPDPHRAPRDPSARPTDVEAMAAYQSRPDVCRYLPYEPRGADVIAARVADPELNRTTLDKEGDVLWLGLAPAGTDVVIGDVILAWRSASHGTVEIGYVLDPAHQGHGYVTEACRALLALAFDGLGAHRVIARLDARNEPSANVLRRLGMRQEAYLVQNEWFKGEWTDELNFAILADEWRAAANRS